MYIHVEPSIVKKEVRVNKKPLWVSTAVMEVIGFKKKFLIDCYMHSYLENQSLARILLSIRLPKNASIDYSPKYSAPKTPSHKCSLSSFIECVRDVKKDIERIEARRKPIPKPSFRDTFLQLILPRKPIDMEGVSEQFRKAILRDILSTMHLYSEPLPQIKWTPVYVLALVDYSNKRVEYVVGSKKIYVGVHSKYVFENKELLDSIRSITNRFSWI